MVGANPSYIVERADWSVLLDLIVRGGMEGVGAFLQFLLCRLYGFFPAGKQFAARGSEFFSAVRYLVQPLIIHRNDREPESPLIDIDLPGVVR